MGSLMEMQFDIQDEDFTLALDGHTVICCLDDQPTNIVFEDEMDLIKFGEKVQKVRMVVHNFYEKSFFNTVTRGIH